MIFADQVSTKLLKSQPVVCLLLRNSNTLFLSASLMSTVQWVLILKPMGSCNCITGLKAETVSEVQLVVKVHPQLGTSLAAATNPWGLWVLPDKVGCIVTTGEVWAIMLFLIESSHRGTHTHSHSPKVMVHKDEHFSNACTVRDQ